MGRGSRMDQEGRTSRRGGKMGGATRALALGLAIGSLSSNIVSVSCLVVWMDVFSVEKDKTLPTPLLLSRARGLGHLKCPACVVDHYIWPVSVSLGKSTPIHRACDEPKGLDSSLAPLPAVRMLLFFSAKLVCFFFLMRLSNKYDNIRRSYASNSLASVWQRRCDGKGSSGCRI